MTLRPIQHGRGARIVLLGLTLALLAALGVPSGAPASDLRSAGRTPAPSPTAIGGLDDIVSTLARVAEQMQARSALPGQAAAPESPAQPVTLRADAPADPPRPPRGEVSVSPAGIVDLHVSNMDVTDVLRLIADQTRMNIVASRGVQGAVSANLYGVTLDKALDVILSANGFGFRREGEFIRVYTGDELAAIEARERRPAARVFRLRYVTARDAEPVLAPLLSQVGRMAKTTPAGSGLASSATTGSGSAGDAGGDSSASGEALVVVDYPEHLDRIADVLREFDVRPRQVLVEATILRAELNENNALGIDFTTVGGIDFSALNSVSPAAQSISTGLTPNAALQNTTFTARTGFNQNVPSGGFTFGIIKDQISLFIRALEQITDITVLANPKILALNKQRGEVIVGRRDGYLTTTVTETTAVQTVEFLETGTRLLFRPYIYDDDQIRMEIHPEDSTGGLTAANLPFKQTTEVTTNILVRDGHTILIGGLFREVSSAIRSQMPLLGNIPGIGAMFRSTNDALSREEIIILLTVRIVKGEPEEKLAEELRQDSERYRVGQRRQARWFGRERISQAHYHWALDHLEKGDTDRALWDANMAARLDPQQVPAAELREQLLGRRSWDEECSSLRHTLRNLIREGSGKPEADFGRPAPPFRIPEGFEGPAGATDDDDHADNSPGGHAPTKLEPEP